MLVVVIGITSGTDSKAKFNGLNGMISGNRFFKDLVQTHKDLQQVGTCGG